ncbi:2026_t:CDS:2 [Acaulospora colombiana]|uniref:2026_t:CDS:1 n=1 Tax=Acaulospora colombiana TaxID=27376 RepID=A0ACA9JZC9_9GLOM|nr:2026_t:CDS:2 [Acaulospora colombiana]
MSTATSILPSSGEPPQADVIQRRVLGSRVFVLNRPEVYNALNLNMIRSMTPQLQVWNESDLCKVIILKSTGSKSFCAGGDVKRVLQLKEAGEHVEAVKFFEEEYQLNHLIATLYKPFVSVLNGITMGGGVGLSVHAPFRIATENTVFAMPEAKIGFFPDVGGSFFLPRMDGEVGTYLALTGSQLSGMDVFFSGIATHYVPSQRLPLLEVRLSELESDDHEIINSAIEDFVAECDGEHKYSLGGEIRNKDTIEEIIDALKKENTIWAKETMETIIKMSPTSLKVTLMELRKGKKMVITDCFKMEYELAQKFMEKSDFKTGVTAVLIKKTSEKPDWNPSNIEDVTLKDVENFYFSHSGSKLKLLNSISFENYPFSRFNLPSEEEICKVVTGETPDAGSMSMSQQEVVDFFLKDRKGKIGVREKVLEVLDRKTTVKGDQEGLTWIENTD